MAVHKVPQDVEADDKLLGPFTFKQFAFLLAATGFFFMAFLAFRISPVIGVLPLPFAIIFVILGLPLRQDQPTDVYVAALINYFLRPKTRIWSQEGQTEHVQITAPKSVEVQYSDGLSRDQVKGRLSNLAKTMDTRGWSSKNLDTIHSYDDDSDRLIAGTLTRVQYGEEEPGMEDILDPKNSHIARSLQMVESGHRPQVDQADEQPTQPKPQARMRTVSEIADIAEGRHPIDHQQIAPIYTGKAEMPPSLIQTLKGGPSVPLPPPSIRASSSSSKAKAKPKDTSEMTNSGQADIIDAKELKEGGEEISLR